jgi:hypothetical protein
MSQFNILTEIKKEIDELWFKKFPIVSEDNRYIKETDENKEYIINYYVDRLIFCDNLKPQPQAQEGLNILSHHITQRDVLLILCSDKIKSSVYEDAKKSKYFKDITDRYMQKKNIIT